MKLFEERVFQFLVSEKSRCKSIWKVMLENLKTDKPSSKDLSTTLKEFLDDFDS